MSEDLSTWADRLESVITDDGLIDRVAVIARTDSTQDAAKRLADGKAGLLVTAGLQTNGRGRLGRAWIDGRGRCLAATFVVDGTLFDDAHLALGSGLAACRTIEEALGVKEPWRKRQRRESWIVGAIGLALGFLPAILGAAIPFGRSTQFVGLRWPNDVVDGRGKRFGKISGTLIERDGDLAYIGIGINVLQWREDWPRELAGMAVSLRQLGCRRDRIEILEHLMVELEAALLMDAQDLAQAWRDRDVLVGTRQKFEYAGDSYSGKVVSIAPTSEIVIKTARGRVSLPALATAVAPRSSS